MLETIKKHPYMAAGGVAVGVLILILMRSGGGSAGSVDGSNGDPTNAMALQLAQIQSGLAAAQISADSRADEIAGTIEIAKIQAGTAGNIADRQLSAQLAAINAASLVQTNHDTLAASVAEKNIAAGVETTRIQSQTTLGTVQAVSNAISSSITQNTEMMRLQAERDRTRDQLQYQIGMQQAENARPRSFLESIFG